MVKVEKIEGMVNIVIWKQDMLDNCIAVTLSCSFKELYDAMKIEENREVV